MQVTGSGALAIDFNRHTIEHIDRIEFASAATAADFTLTDAMAMTADGNTDGGTGDLFAEALVAMTAGVRLDATGFGATRSLRTLGSFDGADTFLGGAGQDTLAGAAGNDLMNGGAGADSLSGGNGADSLVGGAGADNFNGGAGGDRITLTEAATATDRVHYTADNDGTFDINDDSSVNQNTADNIIGFATASDRITLDRAGLGLGSGGIVNVAANGAWNIGTGAVFLFESDSVNSDTLSNNNHASLDAIGFAINFDNAAGSGSSAGRTVALVISNPETQATRTTGIYLWTDTDGDSLVDVGDVVRLLAVLNSVTANQMASGSSIELI
jgi:Ca2+-binding RTX toxin-like protein